MVSPYLRQQIFGAFKDVFVSLHTDEPGISGANELTVERQPLRINDNGVNITDITFNDMPRIDGRGYGYVGIWTAAKGGRFIQSMQLVDDVGNPTRRVANKGDSFYIPAGGLQLTLLDVQKL